VIPLLAALAFTWGPFTLQPDTCGTINPLAPYYIIPTGSPTLVALPVVIPDGDTLTVTSSIPSNLATAIIFPDGETPIISLQPEVASYTNLTCPPAETVSVTDAQGLLSMSMIVDIVSQ
jgi:hypothetical protein